MRIDRLLKGRDDIEAEGSATITMWDELLTQICDLYAITVNKVKSSFIRPCTLECSLLNHVKCILYDSMSLCQLKTVSITVAFDRLSILKKWIKTYRLSV